MRCWHSGRWKNYQVTGIWNRWNKEDTFSQQVWINKERAGWLGVYGCLSGGEVIGGTVMQQVWIDFLAVLLSAKFMEISRMLYDRMGT